MLRAAVLAVLLAATLPGCTAAVALAVVANEGRLTGMGEFTFPARMLVVMPDGREELLTGFLEERVDGRAAYELTGPTFGACTGVEQGGRHQMVCPGQPVLSFRTEAEGPKFSAVHVSDAAMNGTPVRVALSWGDRANERTLRAALAEG